MRKNILIFGDSYTYGFDADGCGRFPPNVRFPGVIRRILGESVNICEAGLPGRTAAFDDPIAFGMNGMDAIEGRLRQCAPVSLLVLMLGTNDIKERFRAGAAMAAEGVCRLADYASSLDYWESGANILIIAPPVISRDYEKLQMALELGHGCYERSCELPKRLEAAASARGFAFLDASKLGMRLSPEDGIHMTAADHELLGRAAAELIKPLF